jgi:hypothetical protein
MWKLTYKWAKHTHPHKPKRWIVSRYFGKFHPTRKDKWVSGDRESGAYLLKSSWTSIVRHVMVKGWASPDDPALAEYWATRRRRAAPAALGRHTLSLLKAQQGRCPLCRGLLLYADHEPQDPQEWGTLARGHPQSGQKEVADRRTGARHRRPDAHAQTHTRQLPTPSRRRQASTGACDALEACLSRLLGKRARPVLWGPGSFPGVQPD